jgi:hypothetical protein
MEKGWQCTYIPQYSPHVWLPQVSRVLNSRPPKVQSDGKDNQYISTSPLRFRLWHTLGMRSTEAANVFIKNCVGWVLNLRPLSRDTILNCMRQQVYPTPLKKSSPKSLNWWRKVRNTVVFQQHELKTMPSTVGYIFLINLCIMAICDLIGNILAQHTEQYSC